MSLALDRPRSRSGHHRVARPARNWRRPATALAALTLTIATTLVAVAASSPAGAAGPVVVVSLGRGTILHAGQSATSATKQFALTMRVDGALVLTAQGQQLWTTGTSSSGAWAVMQGDGNLVVYTAKGSALWNSRTAGRTDATAVITNDGNFSVTGTSSTYWTSGTLNNTLTAGHRLYAGQVLGSAGMRYRLIMQGDGNLVLYGAAALWSSGTAGRAGASLVMQGDGNLVLYSSTGAALWNSRTYHTGATLLRNSGDGNNTITTSDGVAVYQTPGGTKGVSVLAAAQSQRGVRYCYAGGDQHGPTKGRDAACTKTVGYDCSGLALYSIYRALGVLLPHYSGSQYADSAKYGGIKVARAALKPGDLVFFIGAAGSAAAPGHVGIYAGNNAMIDAQQSGVAVGLHTLYSGYVGAVRYWH